MSINLSFLKYRLKIMAFIKSTFCVMAKHLRQLRHLLYLVIILLQNGKLLENFLLHI